MRVRTVALLIAGVILATSAASSGAAPPQGTRVTPFARGPRLPANPSYDGAFTFCRVMFRNAPYGDGGGWFVDYPRADVNLSFRLSELTTTRVSRSAAGEFNHVLLRLTDAELYRCPFIMMTEPGGAYFDQDEAARLRDYLLKGGFLWADPKGHVIVLMTHNTDFGDAFEREGDSRDYFDHFAADGYAFGINVLLYAMSH